MLSLFSICHLLKLLQYLLVIFPILCLSSPRLIYFINWLFYPLLWVGSCSFYVSLQNSVSLPSALWGLLHIFWWSVIRHVNVYNCYMLMLYWNCYYYVMSSLSLASFCHPFTFNLFVALSLKWVSCP